MKPYQPEDGEGEKGRIDAMVADKLRMPDSENIDNQYQDILKQLKELGIDLSKDDVV